MPLPKPQLPIFNLEIPSTEQKVTFRQFTVREEKILIQAKEHDDIVIMKNAIKQIIASCVSGIDSVDDLTLFDVEYILTKIRAKSVGEIVELKMPCDADSTHDGTNVRINLDSIKVTKPAGHSKTVALYDDVGVCMRYPSIDDVDKLEGLPEFDAIILCLEYIYTGDEVFQIKEQTKEDVIDFLESLTQKQLEKIDEVFFRKMPEYKYEFEYKCATCGHEHSKVIKGLSNFFT
jgi:hypothetical protein